MLSSTSNIKIVIDYLHWIQNNLQMIQALPGGWDAFVDVDLTTGPYEFLPCFGLCDNILCDQLDARDVVLMFYAWPECVDDMYPCGDRGDFIRDMNLYCNPKRLRLIEHCIKYLQDELEKRDAQED